MKPKHPTLRKILKRTLLTLLCFSLGYGTLMCFPSLLFGHKVEYRQCTVYSDRPIDPNISRLIDDALLRISRSELYDKKQHFRLYLCNDLWRFSLFTQGNEQAGGVALYDFSRDIFIRPCDIPNNRILPPKSWYFAQNPFSFKDRPLSYYFAHEMTHVMESRFTGRGHWRYPLWLSEGYADYIGKGGDFDFSENLRLLHENAPELDPSKGLYRLHHLKVAYLLDMQHQSIKDIYRKWPEEDTLLKALMDLPFPAEPGFGSIFDPKSNPACHQP